MEERTGVTLPPLIDTVGRYAVEPNPDSASLIVKFSVAVSFCLAREEVVELSDVIVMDEMVGGVLSINTMYEATVVRCGAWLSLAVMITDAVPDLPERVASPDWSGKEKCPKPSTEPVTSITGEVKVDVTSWKVNPRGDASNEGGAGVTLPSACWGV